MRCTYYYFFKTMEEGPLNEFSVLKQNENVEIGYPRFRALREASGAQDVHSLRFDYNNVLSLKIYRRADCFSKSATPYVLGSVRNMHSSGSCKSRYPSR